jgi:hypothetical protein
MEKLLQNQNSVVDAFGYWPSFHDGEILSFSMTRPFNAELGYCEARVEFAIHCWEMTSKVDDQGHFVLTKHHLVKLRFDGVAECQLDGFNHQNAILGLEISKNKENSCMITVDIDPAYGLGGRFVASRGEVVSVTACDEKGNPL